MKSKLLTVKDIARLGDVTSSAVSNWQNRHKDFPKPKQIVGSSPVFDYREVTTWLMEHNKGVYKENLYNFPENISKSIDYHVVHVDPKMWKCVFFQKKPSESHLVSNAITMKVVLQSEDKPGKKEALRLLMLQWQNMKKGKVQSVEEAEQVKAFGEFFSIKQIRALETWMQWQSVPLDKVNL